MRFQGRMVWSVLVLLAGAAAPAQQVQPQAAPTVIRSETKLVLVDVVVTGKKGVYVEDLEMKNFKVWEDNKEQQLKTFSFGADPQGPAGRGIPGRERIDGNDCQKQSQAGLYQHLSLQRRRRAPMGGGSAGPGGGKWRGSEGIPLDTQRLHGGFVPR